MTTHLLFLESVSTSQVMANECLGLHLTSVLGNFVKVLYFVRIMLQLIYVLSMEMVMQPT